MIASVTPRGPALARTLSARRCVQPEGKGARENPDGDASAVQRGNRKQIEHRQHDVDDRVEAPHARIQNSNHH